jgi:DNA-binding response OmpR family regulator
VDTERPRILIVDDELDLVWALRRLLSNEGYEVLTANDGMHALALARSRIPDLIILDVVMHGMDGWAVCRSLRQDPVLAAVPILFLTVRSDVEDRIKGLDAGADDYLVKPFDPRELKACIHALLRRGQPAMLPSNGSVLAVGSLTLDPHTRQAWVGDKAVALTPAEFNLLHYLMRHPGEVFSSETLLEEAWGYTSDTATVSLVRWHVKNLRAKLEPDPCHPTLIRTMQRHGYILSA